MINTLKEGGIMSMFKKLLLVLCFGVTTAFVYGCTQPQKAGDEAVVEEETVEEVAVPTAAPAATPAATSMGDTGEGGTN
jgi:hypothetical protein